MPYDEDREAEPPKTIVVLSPDDTLVQKPLLYDSRGAGLVKPSQAIGFTSRKAGY